jgi:DNA mismatch repair protein MutL
MENKLYIIDQHAAHEKVLYERLLKDLAEKKITAQYLTPTLIVSLTIQQAALLEEYMDVFQSFGFEIESFGGREYSIRAVPDNLFGIATQSLFIEMLDNLSEENHTKTLKLLTEKLALMACKAAIKGNAPKSKREVEHLIEELLGLENPYHCPHGRPTIISMTKYELEKKFKRIL